MGKLTQASTLPGPDTEHRVSNTGSPACPRGGQCLSTWRPELTLQPWGTRAQSLPTACSPAPRSSRLSPGPHPQGTRACRGTPQVSPILPWAPWSPSSRTLGFALQVSSVLPVPHSGELPQGLGSRLSVWTGLAGCRPQSEHSVDREVSGP